MLELRPVCEHCGRSLAANSEDAMICSFECTFCKECVEQILQNVCPNCGGEFSRRPVRPLAMLDRYPATTLRLHHPVDLEKFAALLERYGKTAPRDR